jgi:AcrR family transcriptional regulator
MIDTKQKLLDTAERLIGEKGYAATSLRHIISEAGVNLASIHYHFGSKEELLDEMILRKAGPVNSERIARLDRLESESGGAPVPVRDILAAFLEPMAETADRNPSFVAVMGRLISEGLLPAIVERHFQSVTGRIVKALHRALPQLSDAEFAARVQFMSGAMAQTMCGPRHFPGLNVEETGYRARIDRLVTFLTGGFEAPATANVPQEEHK